MPLLSLLIVLSAVLTITGHYQNKPYWVYIFKPLTTLLIAILVFLPDPPHATSYQYLIFIGLLFSLLGDIFLMLPTDRFIYGLGSFLVAHLFYIAAFTLFDHGLSVLYGMILGIVGFGMLRLLWPGLKHLKLPVVLYAGVLISMAWIALSGLGGPYHTAARLASTGALFFVFSDATLAYNRFRKPFHLAQALILGTYYVAQWLIALSVGW